MVIRLRLPYRFAGTTAGMLALALVTGCSEAIHNSADDDRFIRTHEPGADPSPGVTMNSGPLLPTEVGTRWHNRMLVRPVNSPAGVEGADQSMYLGDDVITESRPVAGGTARDVTLTMWQNGIPKPYRKATYRVKATTVSLVSLSGEGQSLILTPPMPLIQTPPQEGSPLSWDGSAQTAGQHLSAKGYSRISRRETLKLDTGKYGSFRVDTVLRLDVGTRQLTIPMTHWFSPGSGILKQKFFFSNAAIQKDVVSFSLRKS